MFISITKRGYTRDGTQFAHGRFLVLCRPDDWDKRDEPIRAFVCYARMSQLGHFMMARVTRKGHRLSLSGSYGGDGLPCSVPRDIYDSAVPVPADLIDKWNHGGGWNSAGSEAPAMRAWALATFPK